MKFPFVILKRSTFEAFEEIVNKPTDENPETVETHNYPCDKYIVVNDSNPLAEFFCDTMGVYYDDSLYFPFDTRINYYGKRIQIIECETENILFSTNNAENLTISKVRFFNQEINRNENS